MEDQRFPDAIAVRRRWRGRTKERKLDGKGRKKSNVAIYCRPLINRKSAYAKLRKNLGAETEEENVEILCHLCDPDYHIRQS